jgi:hypothetical protein
MPIGHEWSNTLFFPFSSFLLLSGITEARNTDRQLTMIIHAVFGWNDRDLPTPGGDIEEITVITLSQNETHQGYLRD